MSELKTELPGLHAPGHRRIIAHLRCQILLGGEPLLDHHPLIPFIGLLVSGVDALTIVGIGVDEAGSVRRGNAEDLALRHDAAAALPAAPACRPSASRSRLPRAAVAPGLPVVSGSRCIPPGQWRVRRSAIGHDDVVIESNNLVFYRCHACRSFRPIAAPGWYFAATRIDIVEVWNGCDRWLQNRRHGMPCQVGRPGMKVFGLAGHQLPAVPNRLPADSRSIETCTMVFFKLSSPANSTGR